jgi:hypothetical protein
MPVVKETPAISILYDSPRACSMASQVALEEARAVFEAVKVDIVRERAS